MIRPHWTTREELCMLKRPSIVYLPLLWILNLPETREHFYWEMKLPCSKNLGPRTITDERRVFFKKLQHQQKKRQEENQVVDREYNQYWMLIYCGTQHKPTKLPHASLVLPGQSLYSVLETTVGQTVLQWRSQTLMWSSTGWVSVLDRVMPGALQSLLQSPFSQQSCNNHPVAVSPCTATTQLQIQGWKKLQFNSSDGRWHYCCSDRASTPITGE